MPINFSCPQCGKQTNVADQYAGQTGPCQACGAVITIPYPDKPAYVQAPAKKSSGGGGAAAVVVILSVAVVALFLCGGIAVALLLPAVQAAREAARRAQCSNNMKQVMLALHNYHDSHGTMPPAVINDKNGNPMHSWRTLILPYLEEDNLHQRYDFNLPWDSPENQAVVNTPIALYQCPSDPDTGPTSLTTNYMFVVGPGAMFDGQRPVRFADVLDGTSNTIAIVEVLGGTRNWAEPGDVTVDELIRSLDANTNHVRGINVGMADGSVIFLPADVDREQLRLMLDPRDGRPVMLPNR